VLALGLALAFGTVNVSDLLPQALRSYAFATFLVTVVNTTGVLYRRRAVIER
jgi:hypothetical protein